MAPLRKMESHLVVGLAFDGLRSKDFEQPHPVMLPTVIDGHVAINTHTRRVGGYFRESRGTCPL